MPKEPATSNHIISAAHEEFHWDVLWLATVVYFIQGALGIAGIALPIYLRNQGLSISQIALYSSIATAPWFFKIIYGAISDSIPLWHLRRKPYLVICSILSSIGWVMLAFAPPTPAQFVLSMFLANIGFAATDVITDGLVVEHSNEKTAQIYQGISWGARSLGSIIAGVTGGVLASQFPAKPIFLMTSCLPMISLGVSFFIKEEAVGQCERTNVLKPILESFRYLAQADFRWFLLIFVVGSVEGASGTPFFFYLREHLKMSELFLGVLSSVGWCGAAVGCVLFTLLAKKLSLKQLLYLGFLTAILDVLSTLLIQNKLTAISVTIFSGLLTYLALLPLLTGAARLSHTTHIEGCLFAMMASVYNLGQAVFKILGSYLSDLIGFQMLLIMMSLVLMLGFFIIPKLKTL